ncbi:hypothetical protein T439DRAFT_252844 [Meredithblackwellia eburnea MCA 4105]
MQVAGLGPSSVELLISFLTVTITFSSLVNAKQSTLSTIPTPLSGNASLTHYDLPLGGYVASCGCGGNSSYYPTAALSQGAYGSTTSSGPGCGQCFNLTLNSAYKATPPFNIPVEQRPWIVVKITDSCPKPPLYDPGRTWCGATRDKTNMAGTFFHFDLSSPSPSIPLSWFPTPNETTYGYSDFGVWLIEFSSVSCSNWAGYQNDTASIVDPSLEGVGSTACCPTDPLTTNQICPATSLKVGDASPPKVANKFLFMFSVFIWGVIVR